ncbi:MAG: CRISPR-associated endonuclease Cas1 [Bryobacterales bacterium]|nr:CRISPR-associated endonuclease Cas1 [Bryobacterales bacterium]
MANRRRNSSHLFDRLTDPGLLTQSWRRVREHYPANKLPPPLAEFDRRRAANIDFLAAQLRDQTFFPQPASLIHIPKPNHPGEQRPIAILPPEDRIVLTSLNTLLYPIIDRTLLPGCTAYRAQRGASLAIRHVTTHLQNGLTHVATGDVDNFFASIPRQRLLHICRRLIWDTQILNLLEAFLNIGTSTRTFEWADTGIGIAQGSPLSPLLSNLYLADFDQHLHSSQLVWQRYADNILLLSPSAAALDAAWTRAVHFLESTSLLRLNPDSVSLAPASTGFEFLGIWFQADSANVSASMAPARLQQKRASLAALFRQHPSGLPELTAGISESVLGWRNYYGAIPGTRPQLEILERHISDLLVPWLQTYRSAPANRQSAAELKAALIPLELPVTTDPRKKIQWIELLLSRSKPPVQPRPANSALSPLAAKALHQRKQQLADRRQELEEIIVTKPGTYLGRTGERLLIRRDGKREAEIPFSLIRNITFLTTAFSLSGEFMVETAARGIPILIAGPDGRPSVRIGPPDLPAHELSLAQSALAASPAGLDLARIIVLGKIRNQVNLLQYFMKYPERRAGSPDYLAICTASIAAMNAIVLQTAAHVFSPDHDLERNRLFAAEGQAAQSYWAAIRALLWWKPGFDKRVHRGASDLVNSLLNYGYGILYSRLLAVLVKAGLNANIGFLHKPQPGKAGLLYDCIEEFRAAAVDRTVFALLNLATELKTGEHGLEPETRHLLARKVLERLQAKVRYHGETLPLQKVMELQVQLLVRHIGGKERYKCFVLPW